MAVPTRAIPRFLLPQTSPLWTSIPSVRVQLRLFSPHRATTANGVSTVRYASKATPAAKGKAGPSKPIVLDKPLKFNPPSHGSRLPSKGLPKHYGGPLTREEVGTQERKDYPGLMAPKGTWAHWFWTSRSIHIWISMGTLAILALVTVILDFVYTSPFRHMLPELSEFWTSPITFISTVIQVVRIHEKARTEKVLEGRVAKTNDVAKRRRFQAVHGLDKQNPIRNMLKGDYKDGEEPEVKPDGVDYIARDARDLAKAAEAAAADAADVAASRPAAESVVEDSIPSEGDIKRRKWFGIF